MLCSIEKSGCRESATVGIPIGGALWHMPGDICDGRFQLTRAAPVKKTLTPIAPTIKAATTTILLASCTCWRCFLAHVR